LGRSHFRELVVLLELINRPTEDYRDNPVAFASAAAVAASVAPPHFDDSSPTAEAAAQAGSAAGGIQLQGGEEENAEAAIAAAVDGSLPWERDPMRLLVEALFRTGRLCHLGLLHACMPLFHAGRAQVLCRTNVGSRVADDDSWAVFSTCTKV
jgi:hypothetical protein